MDIIFNCPKCEQELAVDVTASGSEITCPSCNENIVIPAAGTPGTRTASATDSLPTAGEVHPVNPIASSAAAKVEMHLKVPVRTQPTERLIEKAPKPLEVAAKESDRRIKVKTIRRVDCVEVGHDHFDETVTKFIQQVGEQHILQYIPVTYTYVDIGSQKILTDFGVMMVYRA
jgi:DNA-directed RNA polymerase subunit RPC12/RpoP